MGLSALGFGVGAETTLVELEELQTWAGGTVGCECGLQLLLELEHLEQRLMGNSSNCFF